MKFANKILIVLTILLIGFHIFTIASYAATSEEPATLSEMSEKAQSWIDTGKGLASGVDSGTVSKNIIPLGQALTTIGSVVFISCICLLAAKYMKANPDEQAKIKQQAIGLVLAGIVIFGAFSIWSTLYDYFKTM